MKQRIANALQAAGAVGLTIAAGTFNVALGLAVGSVSLIVAGVLVAT